MLGRALGRHFPLLLVNVPDPMGMEQIGNRTQGVRRQPEVMRHQRPSAWHLLPPGRLWIGLRAQIWGAAG